jgi:uncharacterized membrane protein
MTALEQRKLGVDLLRGAVMLLMALDHARDLFSPTAFRPEDLAQAGPALFATRWVTHFCAPVFVFLAGTSAWLQQRGAALSPRALGRFLVIRGLWLIALELLIVNPSWSFAWTHSAFVQVIWAIGVSMLVLALLVQVPRWVAIAFGLVLVVAHNAFDPVEPADLGGMAWLWRVLHEGGPLQLGSFVLYVAYPLVPWVAVMALGYGLAPWLVGEQRRDRTLLLAGLAMIGAFVVLRVTAVYGDPAPWEPDPRGGVWSLPGALNTQKYPPSLLYLLMTLGPACLALVALDRARGAWVRPVAVFGRVPLFFYLLHVPLLHVAALVWAKLQYGRLVDFFAGPDTWPPAYAPSLARAYLAWLGALLVLYPLCAWYDRVKQRRRDLRWLRFL